MKWMKTGAVCGIIFAITGVISFFLGIASLLSNYRSSYVNLYSGPLYIISALIIPLISGLFAIFFYRGLFSFGKSMNSKLLKISSVLLMISSILLVGFTLLSYALLKNSTMATDGGSIVGILAFGGVSILISGISICSLILLGVSFILMKGLNLIRYAGMAQIATAIPLINFFNPIIIILETIILFKASEQFESGNLSTVL